MVPEGDRESPLLPSGMRTPTLDSIRPPACYLPNPLPPALRQAVHDAGDVSCFIDRILCQTIVHLREVPAAVALILQDDAVRERVYSTSVSVSVLQPELPRMHLQVRASLWSLLPREVADLPYTRSILGPRGGYYDLKKCVDEVERLMQLISVRHESEEPVADIIIDATMARLGGPSAGRPQRCSTQLSSLRVCPMRCWRAAEPLGYRTFMTSCMRSKRSRHRQSLAAFSEPNNQQRVARANLGPINETLWGSSLDVKARARRCHNAKG